MKDKIWPVLRVGCIATILLLGCGLRSESTIGSWENGQVATAEAKTLAGSVYAYGVIEARRHSTLSAKFPGKLERIMVREGEEVREGQLLALFEAKELSAQLTAARVGVKVAEGELAEAKAGARPQEIGEAEEQLRAAEAELAKMRLDWQRAETLYAEGVLPKTDWETAGLRLTSGQSRRNAAWQRLSLFKEGTRPETIELLRRRVDLARAQVAQAEAAVANARITAPYDGVITRKHREEGEALDIGLPVMDIGTLKDRYVRAEIDETDIGRLRIGQPAMITADGFPGAEYAGQVVDIKKQMGPKRLIPTDPAAIIDYKVLDVEISLPSECPFPIKLPVNVRIGLE